MLNQICTYGLLGSGVIIMILGVSTCSLSSKVDRLEAEKFQITSEKLICEGTLSHQNEAIKLFKERGLEISNTTKEEFKELDKSTESTIYTVKKKLGTNPTSDNVITEIDNLLKEYSND